MTRSDVLNQIDSILMTKCRKCKTRKELYKQNKSQTHQDGHCIKQCPIGAELQELGKML